MEGVAILSLLIVVVISYGFSCVQSSNVYLGIHCIESEKNALIKFSQGFKNPPRNMLSWMLDENCCQWKGVECDNTTGHVITLDLQKQFLQGEVPHGYQFDTFESNSYVGNPNLCGFPLSRVCSDNLHEDMIDCSNNNNQEVHEQGENNNWLEEFSFYISMGIGFNTGFLLFWVTLMLKKSWRYAYMRCLENMGNKIYVFAAIRLRKIQAAKTVTNCPN
ncbi:hypothetical protein AABB24_040030 [Solanum stoloniferum]|uniref:Leucine-rich repeat-containing N-terminal plant-type domain-containing protein n=1 Tax=Solanum stoloniferum TaxID=62892 RepID=A0ABD2QU92_9SOLN